MASKYDFLMNKVIIKFNMFSAGMKHLIRSHVGSTEVNNAREWEIECEHQVHKASKLTK